MPEDDPFGTTKPHTPYRPKERPRPGIAHARWIVILLAILAIGFAIWFLPHSGGRTDPTPEVGPP